MADKVNSSKMLVSSTKPYGHIPQDSNHHNTKNLYIFRSHTRSSIVQLQLSSNTVQHWWCLQHNYVSPRTHLDNLTNPRINDYEEPDRSQWRSTVKVVKDWIKL